MIRRWLLSFAIVSALVLVQSTWLDFIAVKGIVPDVSLLVVVFIAFKSPGAQGQAVGLASGFLQDSVSAAPLGLNAFIKTGVALLANLLSGKFYIDRLLMPALFGLLATVAKAVYLEVLGVFFRGAILSYDFFGSALWIEAAYNAVAAPILFFALKPVERFIVPTERKA